MRTHDGLKARHPAWLKTSSMATDWQLDAEANSKALTEVNPLKLTMTISSASQTHFFQAVIATTYQNMLYNQTNVHRFVRQ